MSTFKTTNYQLHKWDGPDNVSRVEFNENWDKLDAQIKAEADANVKQGNKIAAMEPSLVVKSQTAPTDTKVMWADTNFTPAVLRIYDSVGLKWVLATRQQADQLPIIDPGNHFTGENIEAALKELGDKNIQQDTDVTNLTNTVATKYDKSGGELTGDVTVKKSIPSVILDAGRTGKAGLIFNATPTANYGLNLEGEISRLQIAEGTTKELRHFPDKAQTAYNVVLTKANANGPAFEAKNVVSSLLAHGEGIGTGLVADGTLQTFNFAGIAIDNKSEFNATTDEFIPKATGHYSITAQINHMSLVVGTTVVLELWVNGVIARRLNQAKVEGDYVNGGSCILPLNANDKVQVKYSITAASGNAGWYADRTHTFLQSVRLS